MPDYLDALRAAAKANGGRPLSAEQRDTVLRGHTREALRARFINVIRGAGYKGDAPERICAEWLDRYMADIPSFISMLEDYEKHNYDPD